MKKKKDADCGKPQKMKAAPFVLVAIEGAGGAKKRG